MHAKFYYLHKNHHLCSGRYRPIYIRFLNNLLRIFLFLHQSLFWWFWEKTETFWVVLPCSFVPTLNYLSLAFIQKIIHYNFNIIIDEKVLIQFEYLYFTSQLSLQWMEQKNNFRSATYEALSWIHDLILVDIYLKWTQCQLFLRWYKMRRNPSKENINTLIRYIFINVHIRRIFNILKRYLSICDLLDLGRYPVCLLI